MLREVANVRLKNLIGWGEGRRDRPIKWEALLESITDMFARKNADRFARQLKALLTRLDASPVLAGLDRKSVV